MQQTTNISEKNDVGATTQNSFVPIYRQLFDFYKVEIITQRNAPGSRIDSIAEIQSRHRVARETAKQVLKLLAGEGLIIQKPGKGSFAADLRPLKKAWAVALPFYSIHYEYLLGLLSEHAHALGRKFRHFLYYNNWQEEIRQVGGLVNERYEAIIVIPTLDESKTASFYARLQARGSTVALLDHTMAGSFFPYAIQSYDLGVQRGLRYLFGFNEGAVAFIRNEIWAGRNMVQDMMEETYRKMIAERHGAGGPLVIERAGDIDAAFFKNNAIGGIFCCDDADAVRIIGRSWDQGIIAGKDYRLVSYGNTELARYFTPGISSIDPHSEEMASYIADIVNNAIKGEDTGLSQFVVQPDLVIRET
jgi:DNA-binding LacI/PurR family transcriptional regulator